MITYLGLTPGGETPGGDPGRREWSAKIPFGPYLALGALVWMFFGARLVAWYVGMLAS